MWKKCSTFAIALSLIAAPSVFADQKPGKTPTTKIQSKPKLTAQQSKTRPPSTSSKSAKAAPSPTSGTVTAAPNPGYDLPKNVPTP
jgi:hypothetical protein